jgi:hypothetical protein
MLPTVSLPAFSSSSSRILQHGRFAFCGKSISHVVKPSAHHSVATRGITYGSKPITFGRFPVKSTTLRFQPSAAIIPRSSIANLARRTFYTPEPNLQQNFTPTEEIFLDVTAWVFAIGLAYAIFGQEDDEEEEELMDEERSKYYQEEKEFHERRRVMKEKKDQERLDRSRLRRQQRNQQPATVACHHEETRDHHHEVKGSNLDSNSERRRD